MSAFIVGNDHTHALIRFYGRVREPSMDRKNLLDLEQSLINANYKSVNHRYGTEDKPHKAIWLKKYPTITPVEAIKACHCLYYQSCEFEGWEDSGACKILYNIISYACRQLPGYDAAQWEITR